MNEKLFKNAKKKIIHQGKFIRFVTRGAWEYVERHNCSAIVIILAVTDENKLIFVEQYRPPVNKKVIEFPAGLVSDEHSFKGESLFSAANRELIEETGYEARKFKVLTKGPVSPGLTSDHITMLQAIDLKKVSDGGGVGLEDIRVHEVLIPKVPQWLKKMERNRYLIEPKIYAGLYFLLKSNRNR